MITLHQHDRDIENPWLRARLAALPAGAAILDVGCVDGWVLDEYPTALGVDARIPPDRWANRVWVGDAAELPSLTGGFDAVSCVSVLEHVGLGWYGDPPGDPDTMARAVIDQMSRVLAPGGCLFLTVPIRLLMTKDGRPFARPIEQDGLAGWLTAAGLAVREELLVIGHTWWAARDARGSTRRLALITAEKVAQ